MNKVAVIIYHKEILKLYKKEWIEECLNSIHQQTYQNFNLVELNYGQDDIFFSKESSIKIKNELNNHIEAMNYLLDYCFITNDFDYVFNINLDDIYNINRFKIQLDFIKENNYDLVSCEFDRQYDELIPKIVKNCLDNNNNIKSIQEIYTRPYDEIVSKGLNVICHPGVLYSKKFWNEFKYYDNSLGYEDLLMWIKAFKGGAKIGIYMQESLLTHRVHDNNVGSLHK
jgi:hypothetical protein